MTFGEKIVSLRKSKGMSQDQLAELLGVTRQSVSKWERDEVIADTDRILALSRLFDVSCDYLLDDGISEVTADNATRPASVSPPPKQRHWHWLGLIPLLWGVGDLLILLYLCTAYMRLHLRDIPALIYELLFTYPRGTLILLVILLVLLFMLAKIGLGLFLILYGCRKNAKPTGGKRPRR